MFLLLKSSIAIMFLLLKSSIPGLASRWGATFQIQRWLACFGR